MAQMDDMSLFLICHFGFSFWWLCTVLSFQTMFSLTVTMLFLIIYMPSELLVPTRIAQITTSVNVMTWISLNFCFLLFVSVTCKLFLLYGNVIVSTCKWFWWNSCLKTTFLTAIVSCIKQIYNCLYRPICFIFHWYRS